MKVLLLLILSTIALAGDQFLTFPHTCPDFVYTIALAQKQRAQQFPVPNRARLQKPLLAIYRAKTAKSEKNFREQLEEIERSIAESVVAAMAYYELGGVLERYEQGTAAGKLVRALRAKAIEVMDSYVSETCQNENWSDNKADQKLLCNIAWLRSSKTRRPRRARASQFFREYVEELEVRWHVGVSLWRLNESDKDDQWLHFFLWFSRVYEIFPGLSELREDILVANKEAFVEGLRWAKKRGAGPTHFGFFRALAKWQENYPIRDSKGRKLKRVMTGSQEMAAMHVVRFLQLFPKANSPENVALMKVLRLLGDPRVYQGSLYNWLIHAAIFRKEEDGVALRRHLQEIHAVYAQVEELEFGYELIISRETPRTRDEDMNPSLDMLVRERPEPHLVFSHKEGTAVLLREVKQLESAPNGAADLSDPVRKTLAKLTKPVSALGRIDSTDTEGKFSLVTGVPMGALQYSQVSSYRALTIQIPWNFENITELRKTKGRKNRSPLLVFIAPDGEYESGTEKRGQYTRLSSGNLWELIARESLSKMKNIHLLHEIQITDYEGRLIVTFFPRERAALLLGRKPQELSDWVPLYP